MSKEKLIDNGYRPANEGYKPSDKIEKGYQPVDRPTAPNPNSGYQPEKGQKTPPSPPSEE